MIEILNKYYLLGVFVVSVIALSFAYYAQYVWGLEPCSLCIYQRIPYWVSGILSGFSLFFALLKRYSLLILMAVFMGGAGVSFYHSGVEMKIFSAPLSCSGGKKVKGLSIQDLEKSLMARPAVRCDQIALRILGISATQWNLLLFLGLFGVSGVLWIKRR